MTPRARIGCSVVGLNAEMPMTSRVNSWDSFLKGTALERPNRMSCREVSGSRRKSPPMNRPPMKVWPRSVSASNREAFKVPVVIFDALMESITALSAVIEPAASWAAVMERAAMR